MTWSCNHTHYCIDYICYVTLYTPPLPIRRLSVEMVDTPRTPYCMLKRQSDFPYEARRELFHPLMIEFLVFPLSLTIAFPIMISQAFKTFQHCESLVHFVSNALTLPTQTLYCTTVSFLRPLDASGAAFLPLRPSKVELSKFSSNAPGLRTCLLAAAATSGEC